MVEKYQSGCKIDLESSKEEIEDRTGDSTTFRRRMNLKYGDRGDYTENTKMLA